jgi:hypothetical protein
MTSKQRLGAALARRARDAVATDARPVRKAKDTPYTEIPPAAAFDLLLTERIAFRTSDIAPSLSYLSGTFLC